MGTCGGDSSYGVFGPYSAYSPRPNFRLAEVRSTLRIPPLDHPSISLSTNSSLSGEATKLETEGVRLPRADYCVAIRFMQYPSGEDLNRYGLE